MTLKTIDLDTLRACTGGGNRFGLVKDLKIFSSVGGAGKGLPAGTDDRLREQIYEGRGF
jgi:hypothetical protein